MRTITLIDNTLYLKFTYDARVIALVKSLPNRNLNRSVNSWCIPLNMDAPRSVEILENQAGFVSSPEIYEALKRFKSLQISTKVPFLTDLPLYPYQKQIADFMSSAGSSINASFCSSGKTITTLAVIDHLQAKRVLIVCPVSIQRQLADEIKRWLPNSDVKIARGSSGQRARIYESVLQFLIIGYEILRIDISLIEKIPFSVVWFDEIHKLSSHTSLVHKCAKRLSVQIKLGTTATLISNDLLNLWGVMDIIAPNILPSYWQFLERYTVKDFFGSVRGYKNIPEIMRLCAPYLIRKELTDVALDLPDVTHSTITFDLSVKERKLYDQIRAELLNEIAPPDVSKVEHPINLQLGVVKIGKLQELTDSMELLGIHEDSSKVELLKEHLALTMADGVTSVIVYTRFNRMAQILLRELAEYNPVSLTGSVSQKQRDYNIDALNAGKTRLIIVTGAGGVGLNLQKCNVMYKLDSSFSLAENIQLHGRIRRIGQSKPCFIYQLTATNTIDSYVQKKLNNKQALSDSVFSSLSDIQSMLKQ